MREKGGFHGEINGLRKNGETFPAMLSISILNNHEGKPIGRMGVFTDITERKQAEEALRDRFDFMKLASELSGKFITVPLPQIGEGF